MGDGLRLERILAVDRCKRLRTLQGIGLREMAKRLKVQPSNLCRYEKGAAVAGLEFIEKYANQLGFDVTITFAQARKPEDTPDA